MTRSHGEVKALPELLQELQQEVPRVDVQDRAAVASLLARVADALAPIRRYYYKHGKQAPVQRRAQVDAAIRTAQDALDHGQRLLSIGGDRADALADAFAALRACRRAWVLIH